MKGCGGRTLGYFRFSASKVTYDEDIKKMSLKEALDLIKAGEIP